MELPIQIIIVLFVTIVVGSTVVIFAGDIIQDARNKINNKDIQEEKEDNLIELAGLTDNALKVLIEDCYEKNKQDALSKKLCYIVHSPEIISSGNIPILDGIPVNLDNLFEGQNTFYIYYNPDGNQIEIST